MTEEITLEKAESVGVEHEYTDLKVDEISVVDRPANQKEFAVIKCVDSDTEQKGVEPMADQVVKSTKEAANVEVVPVEVAKSDDDTAMEQALENLDTISKSIAALTAKVEDEEGGGETETETETEAEKASKKETPVTVFAAALKASGVKGETFKTAMKKYEKVCSSATVQKTKTETDGIETETAQEGDNDFMGNLAAAVTKAKALTPKRLAALKALQEQLAKMIGEMEGIPHSKSPKTKVPKDTSFGASGLSTITKSLETVSTAMKTLTDRITKIENVRQGSKSLGESGTVTTKKADGSLWKGVL